MTGTNIHGVHFGMGNKVEELISRGFHGPRTCFVTFNVAFFTQAMTCVHEISNSSCDFTVAIYVISMKTALLGSGNSVNVSTLISIFAAL